jgi:hypothetical protein
VTAAATATVAATATMTAAATVTAATVTAVAAIVFCLRELLDAPVRFDRRFCVVLHGSDTHIALHPVLVLL